MDTSFADILSLCKEADAPDLDLVVSDCTFVRLTDKAFEKSAQDNKWYQNHLGLAFKFESLPSWHCVWAAVVEHENGQGGHEIFRSYEDVYLQPVTPQSDKGRRSPNKPRFGSHGRKKQTN